MFGGPGAVLKYQEKQNSIIYRLGFVTEFFVVAVCLFERLTLPIEESSRPWKFFRPILPKY